MKGVKVTVLVIGSMAALLTVAAVTYWLVIFPSLISLLSFVTLVPVFLILGLGLFRIARA
ncbi:hypothetical protein JQ634_21140 [Bradyrhizobium sp. AUGA SZCCT0240]|jgi:hypothetical protein|uniref:hypothetical protein n=1 Tax=unclassified Bradyrhizobium TaxID=2631580 RepID=UPI001BAC5AAB|nr:MULTISPECIES: hypothetical protein [unclassified Bradyrhizobium]MBR1199567.1 hypothetical protein [Bradyrhizobium sp. AUGA SZCCT0158]MBR1243634.1 hypothetical protein [Bradyrhizobium sp. AUGA SZCCT0274]MBR1256199.1 hypothetical protein [Bradyrhizobium sp. AUGA SZCCT0240]